MLYEVITGLGLGGLAFAMAAKDSVANLFGGFTIFTDKPFTIRDRIVVNGYDGTVEEIGIRSTVITSYSIHYTKLYDGSGLALPLNA